MLEARGAGFWLATERATYRLVGWEPGYAAYLDQEVVVTGQVRGATLEVSAIAPSGG